MRAFIAIPLPEEIKSNLVKFQTSLKKLNAFEGNFVKENALHLTLKFLGEISKEKAKEISKVLAGICKKRKRFKLSLKGLGAFPSEHYARVVWAGVEQGGKEAKGLQKEIEKALAQVGFKPERRYENHITLARIKFVRDKPALLRVFAQNKEREFGTFEVNKIQLIKSTLTKAGPIYEILEEFKLA